MNVDLGAELTAVVAGVPGVLAVYPARPAAVELLGALARRGAARDLVGIARREGEIVVSVHIGVDDSSPAASVARVVADVLRAAMTERGEMLPVRVSVRVGRIG